MTRTRVPGEIEGRGTADNGARNAKEYWRQVYTTSKQSSGQSKVKRKHPSSDENPGKAKRHQWSHDESSRDGSTAPAVELATLGVDANLDDPQSRRDLHQLQNAVMSFGQGKCKLVDGKWQLDNFGTSLYPHQVIGVSWMLSRELHPAAPTGGILADEMGLGKTVQLLACMSQNLPRKHSKASKTLVVAPKRLITQWYNEIKTHCSNKKMNRVFIYAANKVMTDRQWEDDNIILTNYSQLQRQLPPLNKLREVEELKQDGDPKWKTVLRDQSKGGLFKVSWHRVVLDEAHAISNRASRTSRACRLLLRRYSWVLSGTPLTNDTDEFFPYLDFIRSTYSDFGEYHDAMGDISNVPENRPTEIITVEFAPREGQLYRLVNEKLQQLRERARNRKAGDGSDAIPTGKLREYFNYLRYFTSHPALVERNYLDQRSPQPHGPGSTGVEEGTTLPAETGTGEPSVPYYFCRACCNALVNPRIGDCGHAFCRACIKKLREAPKQDRHCLSCGKTPGGVVSEAGEKYHRHTLEYFENLKKEFAGSGMVSKTKRTKRVRKPGDDEFGNQPRLGQRKKARRRKRKAKKGKKKKKNGRRAKVQKKDDAERMRTYAGQFLQACDKKPWYPIPHSAKTRATMDLVNKWQAEAPDDKIIIFIQWIPMLSFLGRMLFQNGLKFVYLWGEMGSDEQEMVIKAFQQVPEIKIMLISVSCGAHGLNLTAANRAIVFDHWWHEGLERQAFARVHRIGQTKEVHTAKLVAAGSMDEAILGMQARKRETIGSAVGDGTAHPKYHEDGYIDSEMLDLARLEDISDDESGVDEGGDSDSDSDSESESDTDSDSVGGSSDDEGEDQNDGDYEGASDATAGSSDESEDRYNTAQGEDSEDDTDMGSDDE
ncbi:SNF2 family N-terminal domain-containing protein [Chaetomium sp. MPI-CAGE-AT-0009]|nr:SNF2 family N-terminal domain-containing protein [Chaetomium sp. MPI-CAGE-AT-0009]